MELQNKKTILLAFICIFVATFILAISSYSFELLSGVFISPWRTPFCISGMGSPLATNSHLLFFVRNVLVSLGFLKACLAGYGILD